MQEKDMQDVPQSAQETDSASAKTVLIVEDDAAIGEALMAYLQDATAYQVLHVSDGFEALKVVRTLIPRLRIRSYTPCQKSKMSTNKNRG
jgi:DNA-binding NtrC family response regulator